MYLPPICGNRRIFQQKHLPSFQTEKYVDRDLQHVGSILLEVEQLSGVFASIQNGIIYVTVASTYTVSMACTFMDLLMVVTSNDCRTHYKASLTNAFKSLLENEDFVDMTLSAGGKTLRAHKVVLSACSSYFKNLLKGNIGILV